MNQLNKIIFYLERIKPNYVNNMHQKYLRFQNKMNILDIPKLESFVDISDPYQFIKLLSWYSNRRRYP